MLEEPTTQSLSEYEIHDVLRNERRTQTLKYLKRRQETVTLRNLAETLASVETGESPPPRNVRESVYNSLHQTHLPKLDDLGVVEYERDRKRVRLSERARQVDVYMEVVPDHGVTWATYHQCLGALSLVVVTLASLGVPMFVALSTASWAGGFLVLFAISALFRLYKHRWYHLEWFR